MGNPFPIQPLVCGATKGKKMKKQLGNIHTQLLFNSSPVFIDTDINMVMVGLKNYDMAWLVQRKPLLVNPEIIDFVKSCNA